MPLLRRDAGSGREGYVLEIHEVSLDKLIPYVRNPRKNDRAVSRMMASIKEFGFKIPLLVRRRGEEIEVVDGHLRVKASRKLGMTVVPVIFCDEWSEAQVKAFRLLVNRSVSWAAWDEELVALELADLNALDFDLSLTGFDPFEIDEFLFPDAAEPSAEKAPDPPESPVTRSGDLWRCDSHRVLAGDATSPEAVAALLGSDRPRLLLTDPPYSVNYDPTWRERAGLEMLPTSGTPVYTRRKSPGASKPLAFAFGRRLSGVNSILLLAVEIFHGRTSRAGMLCAKAKPRTGAGIASSPRYGKWRI
jgi:hypothetical protein